MAVDSAAANRFLNGILESTVFVDSDDCSTENEEDVIERTNTGIKKTATVHKSCVFQPEDRNGDYHKMYNIQTRKYQVELLNLVRTPNKNYIICLPTGSGKTYIALKLAEDMLPKAIQNGKKIVFLANNVPLVHQQAKYFSSNLVCTSIKDDSYVRAISGDLNCDIWRQEQWDEIMSSYHILVMSTQIFLDAITKAYVKWSEVALLILDECHHARKDHPMALLMRHYGDKNKEASNIELPKVLGLTATIIKGQSKEHLIPSDIKEIEQLLCAKAVTHSDYEDILRHSTDGKIQPRIFQVDYKTSDRACKDIREFMDLLTTLPNNFASDGEVSIIENISHPLLTSEEQIYNKRKGVPKQLHTFLNDLLKTYEEMGPYCAKLAATLKIIYISQWIQELDDMEMDGWMDGDNGEDPEKDSYEADVSALLQAAKTAIVRFMKRVDNKMAREAKKAANLDPSSSHWESFIIRNCVSEKISVLWDILKCSRLKKNGEPDDEICGIIFCQRRITAQVLRWFLEKAAKLWPEEIGFIKPELMLGHSTNVQNSEVSKFTAKRQTNIIKQFHLKKLNVLVATQVVEEGLNVPSCNLVVRFDPILSYPSLVQSLGRARKKGAICYALINANDREKEMKKIENFVIYNKKLAEELARNAIHVDEKDNEDVDDDQVRNLIPPFCPSGDPNGPIITATDAISLVHRYCNSLSCDRLGTLIPTAFWIENNEQPSLFKGFVLLPILSPVHEVVEGRWMPDKTMAKRSAYMETCKQLCWANELNDNLLPKPRSIADFKCKFLQNLDEEFEQEKQTTTAKIGTRKRTQWFRKQIPKALVNNPITSGMKVYAYNIQIKVKDYIGDEKFKSLYDFEKFNLSYGIVTKADLSMVPSFVLLANYGTLQVSISKCTINGCEKTCFNEAQIEKLKSFQTFLLRSIYDADNAVLKPEKKPSVSIVPLQKKSETFVIDWGLVDTLVNDQNKYLERPQNQEGLKFDAKTYENSVLVPWYKTGTEMELFCVIKILSDKSALSPFDEPQKFSTFQEYFLKKYGVEVFHPDYPLLQCKALGKQLNFLSSKTDGRLLRKDMLHSGVKMIPELVNVHNIPGSILIQGRFLPSILHRIMRLMLADEFIRQKVSSHFNWNIQSNNKNAEYLHTYGECKVGYRNTVPLREIVSLSIESDKVEESNEVVLLEMLNPQEITSWEQVIKTKRKTSVRHYTRGRDTNFSMPLPPILNSGIQKDLIPIEDIKFDSFDVRTDFGIEKGPCMKTVMEALTLSNAEDSMDLERLEVMGDSVLKLVVSLHVFRNFPRWDEGKMTLLRMKLISNRHLYQLGKKKEIEKILSGGIFIPAKSFLPPGFSVSAKAEEFVLSNNLDYGIFKDVEPSKLKETESFKEYFGPEKIKSYLKANQNTPHTTYTHSKIGDKSISDAVESLIGAYYVKGGIDGSLRFMEWMGFRGPVESEESIAYSRDDSLVPPPYDMVKKQGAQNIIPLLSDLEEILCYKFKNPWLAVEALTHPTYMGNRETPCYERLEFVGDALLDFLVTVWIFNNTGITAPGKITDLRSALVNNVTFGSLAVRYGFHTFFKYSSENLGAYISKFMQYQEENNHEVSDPYELFSDFDCPAVKEIEVPKVLGDIFESIAGAVFVDSGSIDTVWKVFYRLMKKELESFSKNIPKSPLRQLYERFPGKVKFKKLAQEIPNSSTNNKSSSGFSTRFHVVFLKVPCFQTLVAGLGTTVKQAKQAAAKYVIRHLKSPVDAEYS